MSESEQQLRVVRLSEHAVLPRRASERAAGYDLCACEARRGAACPAISRARGRRARATVVPARGRALVPTDLALAVPPGCYGRVGASRAADGY